jgi:hypothetical protein
VALLVEREVLADDEAGEPNWWVDLADRPGATSPSGSGRCATAATSG